MQSNKKLQKTNIKKIINITTVNPDNIKHPKQRQPFNLYPTNPNINFQTFPILFVKTSPSIPYSRNPTLTKHSVADNIHDIEQLG